MYFDIIVAGATAGSLYCLVAVGFNILYKPTGVFNFAQGDLVMCGAMIAAGLLAGKSVPWPVALAIAALAVALLALLEERIAVTPVLDRSATGTAWIITTLAVSMIIANLVGKLWGGDLIMVAPPSPFSNEAQKFGPLSISSYQIALIVTTLLLVAAIELVYRTEYGKAVLAVAEDRDAALLRGIEPAQLRRWSFALGGALAAVTGYLASPILFASTALGVILLLKGFAAAAMGGLGSNRGALIAGFAIGMVEALGSAFISPGYHQAITLTLVLSVLLLRPGGLFGEVGARRV